LLRQLFVYPDYRPGRLNSGFGSPTTSVRRADNNQAGSRSFLPAECWFEVGDQLIPARLSNDSAGQLRELSLRFVDEKRGLIGYDNASEANPEFYV